jgi:hypothetical protein
MESAERPTESGELPDEFEIREEYAFASAIYVRKPGEMVHIDFGQIDVAVPYPPGHGSIVARVVMHPALAADLAEELSKRLAGTKNDD